MRGMSSMSRVRSMRSAGIMRSILEHGVHGEPGEFGDDREDG